MTRISSQTPASSGSALVDYADGMSDRAVTLWYLPTDLTNYLLGVDSRWGERRSFWDNVGWNYASWHDPADRVVNVVNGFVIGGVNFLSGGSLQVYTEFFRELSVFGFKNHPALASLSNDFFRTAEMYMAPPPHSAYDAGGWTFDLVFAMTATKLTMEYNAWKVPIRQRQQVMDDVALAQQQQHLARTQSLYQWVSEIGGGDVQAALPKLREMALQYPDVMVKGVNVPEQLALGNRAMAALDMLAAENSQAMAWTLNGYNLSIIAEGLLYSSVDIVAAAKSRLLIAVRHAPEEAVMAVTDSVLTRMTVPGGEYGAGSLVEHSAAPQFQLLASWEAISAVRPMVLKSYATIGLNTDLFPVALNAAEGVVRFLPESKSMALELLTDQKPVTRYAMMRALALRNGGTLAKLPEDLVSQLRTFPVKDYLILFGREQSPRLSVAIMEQMLALGNVESLHLMESLVEIAHPMAPRVLKSLCELRQKLPQYAERINAFITGFDVCNIANEIVFNVQHDAALAKDNARLLGMLQKEGNAAAMDALVRLSIHESPLVREIVAEQLVDMAVDGRLPQAQMDAFLREPHPRVLSIATYWSLKDPASLKIHWGTLCQVILEADPFPASAMQILRTQARLGNSKVGYAISQLLGSATKYQQDLLRILQDYPDVRKTVRWGQIMEVAQTSLQDIGFSLDLVRLMIDAGRDVTVLLHDYDPQWFFGAANAGDPRGVAGLELLGMHGNMRAVESLKMLAAKKTDRQALINIPYLANQALQNVPDADSLILGVKKQPTVTMHVTALDLHAGKMNAMASEVLQGRRIIKSVADLQVLVDGVANNVSGALDALYKVAWEAGSFSAEAKELLLRWSVDPQHPHRHTLQQMVRVLNSRGVASADAAALGEVLPFEVQSVRYLETLVVVNREYAPMALEELIRLTRQHQAEVYPIFRRLFKSQDPRVLDLLADRLVAAADQGKVNVGLFNDILSTEGCQVGSVVLFTRVKYLLETTARSSPLEVFREIVMSPDFHPHDVQL